MEEEKYAKMQETIHSGIINSLSDFANGNSGSIDPANEYLQYEMPYDEFGNYAIVPLAVDMVDDYLNREDILKEFIDVTKDIPLSEEEKKMLFIWCVARVIKYKLEQKNAIWQADEWKILEEKTDYYGTRNRAYNQGYDNYMEDHIYPSDYLLEEVMEHYPNKTK